jgi:hypothetical protein
VLVRAEVWGSRGLDRFVAGIETRSTNTEGSFPPGTLGCRCDLAGIVSQGHKKPSLTAFQTVLLAFDRMSAKKYP